MLNRREFLKKSSLIGAAVLVPNFSFSQDLIPRELVSVTQPEKKFIPDLKHDYIRINDLYIKPITKSFSSSTEMNQHVSLTHIYYTANETIYNLMFSTCENLGQYIYYDNLEVEYFVNKKESIVFIGQVEEFTTSVDFACGIKFTIRITGTSYE